MYSNCTWVSRWTLTLSHVASWGGTSGKGLSRLFSTTREALEGRFAGRAVDAIAGLFRHPFVQLPIGVCQVAEFTQWQVAALDVFAARFHDALLLRIPGRTRIDLESIDLRALAMRALYFRLVHAGPRDRALGVVDRHAKGHAAVLLERTAMAADSGGDGLVAHEFGVLVT